MSDKLTKEEVEEKLRSKGEDISNRFGSIESDIPGRKNPLLTAFRERKSLKVGLAVGAGLLVGLFLVRSRSGRNQPDYGDGLDGLSGKLGRTISDMLENGEDADEAVRRALREHPPVLQYGPGTEGVLAGALKQLTRMGANILASELSDYLKTRLAREDKNSDSKSS